MSSFPVVSGDVVSATSGVWRTALQSSHLDSLQDCIEETLPKCKHLLLFETLQKVRDTCTELTTVMRGNELQEHCALCSDR